MLVGGDGSLLEVRHEGGEEVSFRGECEAELCYLVVPGVW